jgi:hypothetical protein
MEGRDDRRDGRGVRRGSVGGGVDATVTAGQLGGMDIGSAMRLEGETGKDRDADARSDHGLHDHHVVAQGRDAGHEVLATADCQQLLLTSFASTDPGGVAMRVEGVVGAPADEIDRVVVDRDQPKTVI